MPSAQDAARSARAARCVLCRRQPVDPAWRPFCSERCKIQDLANWADQAYRVPGEPQEPPEAGETGSSREPSSF